MLWITDDLVDVEEDLASDSWSRPLWLAARLDPLSPCPPPAALRQRLLERGLIEAEAARLSSRLRRIRGGGEPGAERLAAVVALAVDGWIAALGA